MQPPILPLQLPPEQEWLRPVLTDLAVRLLRAEEEVWALKARLRRLGAAALGTVAE